MAEEELTPYQNWTSGELKPTSNTAIDLGLRDRNQRESGPGATLVPPSKQAAPVAVAGETREQRELRQFLASGEAKSQLETFKQEKSSKSRPGSERPGSARPGSERPGSYKQLDPAPGGGSRPASERNAKPGVKASGPATEKSKRKAMFDKM